MKKITKAEFGKNIFFSFVFLIFILINNFVQEDNTTLIFKVILDGIIGGTFVLFAYIKVKSLKNLYRNIQFIYGLSFFIYSIVGCIIFILDNYRPRFYYFTINEQILIKTITIYINTFCIYSILCFSLNKIHPIDYDKFIMNVGNSKSLSKRTLIFFDLFAILAATNNLRKILNYGTAFFSLSTSDKRSIIDTGVSHYINIFMVVYSLFVALLYFSNDKFKKSKSSRINILSIIIYWAVTLTCERRMFVTFLLGFIFIILIKINKIGIKKMIVGVLMIFMLLFSAAIRDNINFSNHSFIDVLYSSTTEFYCTFMISDAYTYDNYELQYGKTYIVDSLSKLFPRGILKNKPEDLSIKFKKQYNTNVGFAFNPVAEGILNFGKYASIMVAIIMTLICSFADKSSYKNILYYIVILTFSLDFCRGAFSNVFFDTLFCFILIFIISRISINSQKIEGDINNGR